MDVPTAIGTIFPCLGVRGITAVMFSRDQLKRAASLTEEDFVQLGKCRRPHNRLGFAYQVGFVRLFDRFSQQQPFELFEELVCFSAAQLRRRHETEFKARWVPLLPRESAKKTFNVGDRSFPERHALFPRRIDAWRA